MTIKHNFNFLLPIWGHRHIATFMGVVVPSLLAEGNLPAMASHDVTFTFLTRMEDEDIIRAWPTFQTLAKYSKTKFEYIDEIIASVSLAHLLHRCYQLGLACEKRDHNEVHFINLNSDVLFADGNGKYLISIADRGIRCLMEAVFRADIRTLLPELVARIDENGVLSVPPRQLVEIGLRHLHLATETSIWNESKRMNRLANRLYWRVGDEGLLARNYLMHPLMIRPVRRIDSYEGFIDYAYVPLACPDREYWHIITDTDDYFRLEFAHQSHEVHEISDGGFTPKRFAPSLESWTTEEHRYFAGTSVRYHVGEMSDAWEAVDDQAQGVINALAGEINPQPKPGIGHPFWTANYRVLSKNPNEGATISFVEGVVGLLFRKTIAAARGLRNALGARHLEYIYGTEVLASRLRNVKGLVLLLTSPIEGISPIKENMFSGAAGVCVQYVVKGCALYPRLPIPIKGERGDVAFDCLVISQSVLWSNDFERTLEMAIPKLRSGGELILYNPVPETLYDIEMIPTLPWIFHRLIGSFELQERVSFGGMWAISYSSKINHMVAGISKHDLSSIMRLVNLTIRVLRLLRLHLSLKILKIICASDTDPGWLVRCAKR